MQRASSSGFVAPPKMASTRTRADSSFLECRPPGFSPALHPITVDDHGGYATIASGSGLVVVLLFALIRLFNIRRVGLHRSEYTLLTATVSDGRCRLGGEVVADEARP